MSSNEKVLFVAVLAAGAFGLWYWYKNGQLSSAFSDAASNGGSPS